MSALVIGLGSPLLQDDGVGPAVLRALKRQGGAPARMVELHAGGLALAEVMAGATRVIVVDALLDRGRPPGEIVIGGVGDVSLHADCSHDLSLRQALELGRTLGMDLPSDQAIVLVAVAVSEIHRFSDSLSADVQAAVPAACLAVSRLLGEAAPVYEVYRHA